MNLLAFSLGKWLNYRVVDFCSIGCVLERWIQLAQKCHNFVSYQKIIRIRVRIQIWWIQIVIWIHHCIAKFQKSRIHIERTRETGHSSAIHTTTPLESQPEYPVSWLYIRCSSWVNCQLYKIWCEVHVCISCCLWWIFSGIATLSIAVMISKIETENR